MPIVTANTKTGMITAAPAGATVAGPTAVHFGNPLSWLIAVIAFAAGVTMTVTSGDVLWVIAGVVVAVVVLVSLQIAQAWEKVVVLRFGHFRTVAGPGIFLLIPAIDTIAA